MKIVNVTLKGEPQSGDLFLVHYCDPRGGRTTAGHEVKSIDIQTGPVSFERHPETNEVIVKQLVASANMQYCGCRHPDANSSFRVVQRGNTMRIECNHEVDSVVFVTEISKSNKGTGSLEVMEL